MPDARVTPLPTSRVIAAGAAWLVLAVLAGGAGLVSKLRFPVPQLVLFTITAVLIALGVLLPRFRAWLLAIDLRAAVALHLTRLVAGGSFLVLGARGQLAPQFAVPAGWGDILVGVLAVAVLAMSPGKAWAVRAYFAWNVIGLADILMVVMLAGVQGSRDPASMALLLRLPLSLLPTWLVPLIIASHVLLFVRLPRVGTGRGTVIRGATSGG